MKLNEHKLALAVIEFVSDNMSRIKNTDVDKHIDELSTFSMEFSSEKYDSSSRTYYHTETIDYGRSFDIPVDRFKKVKCEKFLKEIRHFSHVQRVYLVNTNHKETVLFASNPLPTETSVNDYEGFIKYTKKGISRVQLEIYHNACDRNLTYNCTIINFNLDNRYLMECYDNINYGKHNSQFINKENYKYF